MLVIDEAKARKLKAQIAVEKQKADLQEWVKNQTANAIWLNNDQNPTNVMRQMGRPLTAAQFEAKLKRILPNMHTEFNFFRPDKKALYVVDRRGKNYVCPYESGLMSEHSILAQKDEEVWDGTTFHIDRRDMPKGEWVPGEGWQFDPRDKRPGMKTVTQPWHEVMRGWRTVLIYLVKEGYLSPAIVEREFDSDDRPEWAGQMGKRPITRPW